MSRIELYAHFDRPLAAAELASYRELVSRRLAGESVAYLLVTRSFGVWTAGRPARAGSPAR